MPRLDRAEARSQELQLGVSQVGTQAPGFGPSSPFSGALAGSVWKVEQLELEPVFIWDVGIGSGHLNPLCLQC